MKRFTMRQMVIAVLITVLITFVATNVYTLNVHAKGFAAAKEVESFWRD